MTLRFLDHGSHFCISTTDDSNIHDHLPAEVYTLIASDGKIMLGKRYKRFSVPETRYGKHNPRLQQVINDYDRLGSSIGILLNGLKGSGKSLFAEDLANRLIDQGLPTIMVEEAFPLQVLRAAVAMIGPCVVYLDEFGKIYDHDERAKLLSLFSDTSLLGVVFIVTGNTEEEFTDAFYNRPGRFRFRLDFGRLRTDDALEVAQHAMLNPAMTIGLVRYVHSNMLSYDVLRTVATLVRDCKTDMEATEKLTVYNVPGWVSEFYRVDQLTYRNQPAAVKTIRMENHTVTLTALVGEDFTEEHTIEFSVEETIAGFSCAKSGRRLFEVDGFEGWYQHPGTSDPHSLGITVNPHLDPDMRRREKKMAAATEAGAGEVDPLEPLRFPGSAPRKSFTITRGC